LQWRILNSLSPLISKKRLWRGRLWGTIVVPSEKFLLNLERDLMQPPLGPFCSVLALPDCRLKFPNPVFGCSELGG
jgi:hypothetical protein